MTVTGPTTSGSTFPTTEPPASAATAAFAVRVDVRTPSVLNSRLLNHRLGTAWMSPAGRLTGGTGSLVHLDMTDWIPRILGGFGAPVHRAIEAPDGSVVAIGSATNLDAFRSTNALQPNNAGSHDVWLAKLTSAAEHRLIAVNAASFAGPNIAPGSIATLFTPEVGPEVRFQDLPARVIASAGNQISIVVPDGVSPNSAAEIAVIRDGQQIAVGSALITGVAPAIFTASANGRGAPAAQLLRVSREGVRSEQNPFTCEPTCRPAPIDASSEDVQSILVLYGTGIRNRTAMDRVKAVIGGEEVPTQFAGAQSTFAGLDQVNISLPSSLSGRGEVDLVLVVDDRLSNAVRLTIR